MDPIEPYWSKNTVNRILSIEYGQYNINGYHNMILL